ncbi:aminoacyl-tRNA hydrolase [Candidatus Marinamargulisbacteria bacterium SCGC AAA071-K20]|nr:aminoacyl-tRNA hydrolase [Candidatus Marinamargulisbacteria bacterium SCGC AAA071-K20]
MYAYFLLLETSTIILGMNLIVCLGNPGKDYENTRHNVGFMFGDVLVKALSLNKVGNKFKSRMYSGLVESEKVFLIYPNTFMNLSGEAVQLIASFYQIPSQNCLVIYDDIDIEFGELRLREKGGAGTHNGMKSIIQLIKTQAFPRLRVGVGPRPEKWDLADFVLSSFTTDEQKQLESLSKKIIEPIQDWVKGDFNLAARTLHSN